MVTGPFPPLAFRDTAAGKPNPGAWREVAETDLDLARVTGAATAAMGQVVRLQVIVLDAGCRPVPGAQVELWQADTKGFYNHRNEVRVTADELDPGFGYWGSGRTDDAGRLTVRTIVPGAYPASSSWFRPPHIHWSVQGEGHAPLTTQSYFDGEGLDGVQAIRAHNDADRILNYRDGFEEGLRGKALEDARRVARAELVARFAVPEAGEPTGQVVLRLGKGA